MQSQKMQMRIHFLEQARVRDEEKINTTDRSRCTYWHAFSITSPPILYMGETSLNRPTQGFYLKWTFLCSHWESNVVWKREKKTTTEETVSPQSWFWFILYSVVVDEYGFTPLTFVLVSMLIQPDKWYGIHEVVMPWTGWTIIKLRLLLA